jgi:hypothetical protein
MQKQERQGQMMLAISSAGVCFLVLLSSMNEYNFLAF